MAVSRLIEARDGLAQYLHADSEGGYAIETVADVQPILDHNRALEAEGDGYSPTREWRRVATIPAIIQLRWKELYGIEVWNKDHWPGSGAFSTTPIGDGFAPRPDASDPFFRT